MIDKVLLVGLGDLGNQILRLLCTESEVKTILVGSRDSDRGRKTCNLVRSAAAAMGYFPNLRFVPIDLNQEQHVSEVVEKEKPDLVVHTATMMTWWLSDLLPDRRAARIRSAGFGVWLPVHLALTLKLFRALKDADYKGFTLTAPYPDVVNCVLGRLGFEVTCGMGNLDELVPKIRYAAAERLQTSPGEIKVWLVAHHAFESAVFSGDRENHPPYFLRVEHRGSVLENPDELLWVDWPIPPGRAIHFLTAACALKVARALSSNHRSVIHVPGPRGVPGGYPVEASNEGIRFCEIPGISFQGAVRINEQSHRYDGIEEIDEEGTVIFRSENMEILRQEFDYYYPQLRPEDSQDCADELISKFCSYARGLGVTGL